MTYAIERHTLSGVDTLCIMNGYPRSAARLRCRELANGEGVVVERWLSEARLRRASTPEVRVRERVTG